MKWLRSPWFIGITVVLVTFIALIVAGYWFQWDWTGFPAKTLWDWLNLLGVLAIPVVVGFGAVWYTTGQTKASEKAAEQQRKTELEVAEQRHKTELKIAEDNRREAALQAYIDKMSGLLLQNDLRESQEDDCEVRKIARVRTLEILRRLDPVRKAIVLQFLREAGLIGRDKRILGLDGADLRGVKQTEGRLFFTNLSETDLSGADLSAATLTSSNLCKANLRDAWMLFANLSGAWMMETNLSRAKMIKANLAGANLAGANLAEAELSFANLTDAIVTNEQLSKARSLKGATMPDGSEHP